MVTVAKVNLKNIPITKINVDDIAEQINGLVSI